MPQSFLDFHRITFRYDSTSLPIVQDLSAHFPPGWTGIIGPNGAGKTTLLRLASGELIPGQGEVRASGQVIICSQDTGEPPGHLAGFLRATDGRATRLKGSLRIAGDWLEHWHVLSHGERKRAQIAVALWRRPSILAADEPTNHIDLDAQRLLRAALRSFQGVGLLVSHDRALLDELCERCLVLRPPRAELRPGGYTRAVEQMAAERTALRCAREVARDDLQRLQRVAAQRTHEAARADRRRSKRNLDKHDSDGRGRIDLARVTGKDGQAGRLLSQLSGRLGQAQDRLAGLRVDKEYRLGIELRGDTSPRNALFRLPAAEIPLGERRRLVCPELSMSGQERIALSGPNGSGKSTLVRRIVSLLPLPAERVTYMPQELGSDAGPDLLARLRCLPAAQLGEVMAFISRLGSRPERLLESASPSPGELRKLLLALGMARRPHLIIMDEPTNHLDLPSIECMERALDGVVCGLLLVAHDERFLSRLARRRWVIDVPPQRDSTTYGLRVETPVDAPQPP